MNIQVKSSGGIKLVPIESKLFSERMVFIEGEIDQAQACEFVKEIMVLCKENREKPINVLINSPGGDVNAGLLMYDCIQSCRTPIRMYCLGAAYSMGTLLFTCGNHGRYMFPNSRLMLHEPLLGNKVGGSASSIRSISEDLMETRDKINKILAKHTGKTEKEIEVATSFDHYYSPEESIAFGLADEVVDFEQLLEG